MRILIALGCFAIALISRPAFAGDSGFYLVPSAGGVFFSGGSTTRTTLNSSGPGAIGVGEPIIGASSYSFATSHSADRESLRLGYRFTPLFALEVEGAHVGRWSQTMTIHPNNPMPDLITGGTASFRTTEVGLNAMLSFPVGHLVTLQAGAGVAAARYSVDSETLGGIAGYLHSSYSTTETQYKIELGASVQLARQVALRASVEEFFPQTSLFYPKPHMTGVTLGVVVDL